MELEELKKSYKTCQIRYSRSELQNIFDIRTKSTIKSINRKMFIDALLMVIITIGLISATFLIGLENKYLISGQIIVLCTLLFIHYRLKYWLINNIDFEMHGVNSSINRAYRILRIYWIGYQIFIPGLVVYLLYLWLPFLPIINNYSGWIIYPIAGTILYVITGMLLRIIYGNEMDVLKRLHNLIISQTEHS